jgi:hypothetical protein
MLQLSLNEEERLTLLYLLENCISDLRVEIHETERAEYKEMLRRRKKILRKLWQSLHLTPELPHAE